MALANEILIARYSAILHKLCGMKEGSPSPQLSPEIQAVLSLETDRPEWSFIGGGRLFAAFVNQAAGGAGNRNMVQLANPVGSNVLVVLTRLIANINTGIALVELRRNVTFTNQVTGANWSRDLRDPSKPAFNCFSQNNAAATGTVIGTFRARTRMPSAADNLSDHEWLDPLVLGPGQFLYVSSNADNFALSVSVVGYERTLEPSEVR